MERKCILDSMIPYLHESTSWPLYISNPENDYLDAHEELGKHGCYIILTWSSEMDTIESVGLRISELLVRNSWNNRAPFIIAIFDTAKKTS